MLNFQQTEFFMKNNIDFSKCRLFDNVSSEMMDTVLSCLKAKTKKFQKNQTIVSEGEILSKIGIVLEGEVSVTRLDVTGNRTIVSRVEPFQIFGESFAYSNSAVSVSVVASSDCAITFIDAQSMLSSCKNSCAFHSTLISNLLKIVSQKNLLLNEKIEITSKRTTREKLLTFLLLESKKKRSKSFSIKYDRQELADYLEVDRSGLSQEISKLKREGKIKNHRNEFQLL